MCHNSCLVFGLKNLRLEEIGGKKVIEIGSHDVNGSLRPVIEFFQPAEYLGIDIQAGPGVDVVCQAENILNKSGKNSFDVVISTELLEHVRDWRLVISNMKNICRPGGLLIITTRSLGFPYHAHPYDFWRYEVQDLAEIFSDFEIQILQSDEMMPGVFLKAKKPENYGEKNLDDYELYSIVQNKRVKEIEEKALKNFQKKYERRQWLKSRYNRFYNFIKKLLS